VSTPQTIPPRAQRLHAVWQKLPATPMTESEFHAAITAALDRGVGAEADTTAFAFLLTSSDAVKVRGLDDGTLRYSASDTFPQHARNDVGSAAFDAQTRELAQEQEAQHDRDAEAAFASSPQRRQREELLALIDARIDERILELRRLAASAETAQARSRRREQVEQDLRAATNGGAA
jgi:hypothetical protein